MSKKKIHLREVFLGLQNQMSARLSLNKRILTHPVSKGDASELEWVDMLNVYLPKRYQVDKAFVIDHSGAVSDQIDIVVFDRQFSPFLLKQNGATYIPAESVYAVVEVKQALNPATLRYATSKAASVRRLVRTSGQIVHAGGVIKTPKEPFHIPAGLLTLDGALSLTTQTILSKLRKEQRIEFGCSLASGAYMVEYGAGGKHKITKSGKTDGLVTFVLGLVARLQALGTVPAIDINAYMKAIKKR